MVGVPERDAEGGATDRVEGGVLIGADWSLVGGAAPVNERGYDGLRELPVDWAGLKRTALVVVGPTPPLMLALAPAVPALVLALAAVLPSVANAFGAGPLVCRDEGVAKEEGWPPRTRVEENGERRSAWVGV